MKKILWNNVVKNNFKLLDEIQGATIFLDIGTLNYLLLKKFKLNNNVFVIHDLDFFIQTNNFSHSTQFPNAKIISLKEHLKQIAISNIQDNLNKKIFIYNNLDTAIEEHKNDNNIQII